SAPDDIYSMITNADLKFPSIKDADGNEVELSEGRYIQFMENRDRRVRRDAFETLYGTYNKQRNTLATCLMSSVKKDIFLSRARHYPTSRAFYLDDNNIPEAVYDQLIEVVHEHNPLVHRYMRLRKEALGFGDLHMYDIYTPIVKGVDIKVPFEEAKKTVAVGMAPLGPDYVKALADGMDGGWIDVPENQGKTTGAYCASVYPGPPFVLLNYNDSLDDMFTLAHEMGHAMHGWYSFKHQPHIYSGHRIFLAEVASTLNECLLLDHLIKKATDKTTRLYLLNHYLEQFRGTVFRQTMFAEFEQIIHAKVEGGEALGADALSAIYHDLNVAYYGPEMTVDAPIDLEWGRIPHFYMPFYVYQYATGFSAAVALSQQILKEGAPAVKRYINFLSSGESKYPIDTLKDAGVDMTSPEPVRMALEVFRNTLAEMENLLER
ncbi:MAG TPA: oligoendopeptidase F, partial [Firmicutes bacterium]|nr:oligoendopeptidase F [Bacillota bacterium]